MDQRWALAEHATGSLIDNRWKVEALAYKSSFGSVSYEVSDSKQANRRFLLHFLFYFSIFFTLLILILTFLYLLRVFREAEAVGDSQTSDSGVPKFLHMEIKLLIALKKKNSKFCPTVEYGGETDRVRYLVTNLLGPSVETLRQQMPAKRFTLKTATHIAKETLKCLEEIHEDGFLHRDIKPDVMFVGRTAADLHRVYLFGYELCRKYLDERGRLRPFREKTNFRGSPRFASPNVIAGKEQGRVDDIWAWFLSVMELTLGKLPFNDANGPSTLEAYLPWIWEQKSKVLGDPAVCLEGYPPEFRRIYDEITKMQINDKPKYKLFCEILDEITKKGKVETDRIDYEPLIRQNYQLGNEVK